MTQEFPVAVIGTGVIGRSHIERVLRTPGFGGVHPAAGPC